MEVHIISMPVDMFEDLPPRIQATVVKELLRRSVNSQIAIFAGIYSCTSRIPSLSHVVTSNHGYTKVHT